MLKWKITVIAMTVVILASVGMNIYFGIKAYQLGSIGVTHKMISLSENYTTYGYELQT